VWRRLLLLFLQQVWLADWAARADPPESYIWTSHPWLLSLYVDCPSHIGVECPSVAQQQAVRAAMRAGESKGRRMHLGFHQGGGVDADRGGGAACRMYVGLPPESSDSFLSAISDEFYDVYSDAYYDTGTP
jgi:hypothetical protein